MPLNQPLQSEPEISFFQKEKRSTGIALLCFAIGTAGIYAVGGVTSTKGILYVFGILTLGWIAYRFNTYREERMKAFARRYGWSYRKLGSVTEHYRSNLFKIGHSRSITNHISGTYEKLPFELFHYRYTVGSGKHQHTSYYTVWVHTFPGPLPEMILEENVFLQNVPLAGSTHRSLTLTSEFAKRFSLFVTEDLEIEALEVLTPEIMVFLIDHPSAYSIEFRGNQMYFVESGTLFHEKELTELATFVTTFIDRIGERVLRLHDDVASRHEAHQK